jgi:hypothetical protein
MDKDLKILNAKIEKTLRQVDASGFSALGWPGLSQAWNKATGGGTPSYEEKDPEDWGGKEAADAAEKLEELQDEEKTGTKEYEDLLQACFTYLDDNPSAFEGDNMRSIDTMEDAIEDAGRQTPTTFDEERDAFDELDFRTGDIPYGSEGDPRGDSDVDFQREERESMEEIDRRAAEREEEQEQRRPEGRGDSSQDFQDQERESMEDIDRRAAEREEQAQLRAPEDLGDSSQDFQDQERESMDAIDRRRQELQEAREQEEADARNMTLADYQEQFRETMRGMGVDPGETFDPRNPGEFPALPQSQDAVDRFAEFDRQMRGLPSAEAQVNDLGNMDQGRSSADPRREEFNNELSKVLDTIENSANSARLRDQLRNQDAFTDIDNYIDPRTGNELRESPGWRQDNEDS